jgi:hypothetical protein
MKALALIAAAVLLAAAASTAAHAESARSLKTRCTGMNGKANVNLCFGQVSGMVNELRDKPGYCIPQDTSNQAVVPVVTQYLADHPDDWSEQADDVVGKAVSSAYPCPTAKP